MPLHFLALALARVGRVDKYLSKYMESCHHKLVGLFLNTKWSAASNPFTLDKNPGYGWAEKTEELVLIFLTSNYSSYILRTPQNLKR